MGLAGLQMGAQATSRQLLFILLVATVPEAERAKTERGETERGWSEPQDFRPPIGLGALPGNRIQVAQCAMPL